MSGVTFKKDNLPIQNLVLTPADFDENGMWYSDPMSQQNVSRVLANIIFTDLTPDGKDTDVDFRLQAFIEGQEDNDAYFPLANQFTPYFNTETASKRRLIVSETPTNYDPDSEHIIPNALGNEEVGVTALQVFDVPNTFRVGLSLGDVKSSPPKAAFVSVGVTITGRIA